MLSFNALLSFYGVHSCTVTRNMKTRSLLHKIKELILGHEETARMNNWNDVSVLFVFYNPETSFILHWHQ